MKPISQLKFIQNVASSTEAVEAVIRLFQNPKRHVRGPFYSSAPGNGRAGQFANSCEQKVAISACAGGALDIIGITANIDIDRSPIYPYLRAAAYKVFPNYQLGSYIGISEGLGRKAFLRVAKQALKDLRASG